MTVAARPPAPLGAPLRPLPHGRYGPLDQLRSEWTKLRTVRSTVWTLGVMVVAVVGIGALATWVTADHWATRGFVDRVDFDPTARSLAGLFLGQITIGVLGVLAMSAEYGTGTIRATLAAVPNRPLVLACKAAVFAVVSLVVSEIVVFVAFLLGQELLKGTTPYATLGDPGVLRAVAGSGLVLALIGLFALAIASVIRHTAGSIAAYVGVVLVLPLIIGAFPTSVQNATFKFMPLVIAEHMGSTRPLHDAFGSAPLLSPWAGFAVLCGYTAAIFVIGGVLMVRRDA